MNRISRLFIHVPGTCSGQLEHSDRHIFACDAAVLDKPAAAISVTMPVRLASYEHTLMLPALQTFMPEGFIAERIRERFGKTIKGTPINRFFGRIALLRRARNPHVPGRTFRLLRASRLALHPENPNL